MDRSGIFVDAGYLLAEAGDLCLGAKRRSWIHCEYRGVHEALRECAAELCGLPALRTYWYDAAPDGVPGSEHQQIATLPNLKLRLGRLSGGRQKGVDSLIVRDLMVLARERAITTALLLGGDEDLREGVLAAQDMGVEVVLLGIPSRQGNQSDALIREADRHLILEKAFWAPFFSLAVQGTKPPPGDALRQQAASSPASAADRLLTVRAGEACADRWAATVPANELRRVVAGFPVIPKDIDAPMLREAERELGSLRDREPLRRAVRDGFQRRLTELAADLPRESVSEPESPR